MRGGLCDDLANWTPDHCAAARNLGCDVARVPLGWNRADEEAVKLGMKTIREAKLRPLICIWFHTSDVPSVDTFAASCARFSQLYPAGMYQLLNEPQHPEFGALKVDQTVRYVTAATTAIRQVHNGPKIIAPALTPTPGWTQYFDAMWKDFPKGIDPALHLYPRQDKPLVAIENSFKMARAQGEAVQVTEMGFLRSVYGAERQADLTKAALRRLDQLGCSTAVVYRLARSIDSSEWEDEADLSVVDQARLRRAVREGLA